MRQVRYPTIFTPIQNEGWADPGNVDAEDGIYSTAVSGYGHLVGTLFSGMNFTIPESAEITSIKIETKYKLSSGGSIPQLVYREILDGDARTLLMLYDVPTIDTAASFDPIHSFSIEQLNGGDCQIEVYAQHNVSDRTFYIDYIRIVIDYEVQKKHQVQII